MVRQRQTVGFISQVDFDNFQAQMLEGVQKVLRTADVHLVRFSLEYFGFENFFEDQLAYILGIIEKTPLDGLMFLGWTYDILKNPVDFLAKARAIRPVPMLNIGTASAAVPSVTVDGRLYMRRLLEHLVETHGYRRIVYIHPLQADDRFEVYESYMRKRGLFDSSLVVRASDIESEKDYASTKRARRICSILFDERQPDFDAVISLYSYEAAFILEESLRRGYRIPKDFALVSWEDGDRSRYAEPPITAVYYPFYELGLAAGKRMCQLLRGGRIPPLTRVSGRLNIRQTCGCTPALFPATVFPPAVRPAARPDAVQLRKRYAAKDSPRMARLDSRTLIRALYLPEGGADPIEPHINRLLAKAPVSTQSVNQIHDIEKDILLFRGFVHANTRNAGLRARADALAFRTLAHLRTRTESELGYREVIRRGPTHLMQGINQNIVTTLDRAQLVRVLDASLRDMHIRNAFVFLRSGEEARLGQDRLLFAFQDGRMIPPPVESLSRPESLGALLFHDGIRRTYYQFTLHIKQEPLGFLFIEPLQPDERIYFTMAVQLSSSLLEIQTLENLRLVNRSLEAAKDKITENMAVIQQKGRELEESNAKLSELDRLKSEFIANITHDFRSSLMVILNLSDLSLKYFDHGDAGSFRARFTSIHNASLRLKDTIDRLLELAKMDAIGVRLTVRNIRPAEYLETLAEFYRSAAAASGIRILSQVPAGKVEDFYSDTDKLDEVLHNLISNAVKFVDPVDGVIRLTLAADSAVLRITVEDNGVGIPPDMLDTIFDRFTQVEGNRATARRGTGIGLSFARQLTKYLHGELTAESNGAGAGSRFTLALPRGAEWFRGEAEGRVEVELAGGETGVVETGKRPVFRRLIETGLEEKKANRGLSIALAGPQAENTFDPMKAAILIVDDSPETREIVKEYLAKAGYVNFLMAANGRDGLEAVYRHKPDLIICDYNMPVLRGDEMHDRVVTNPALRQTPFIFLSAVADKRLILERKQKGAFVYLQKPIEESELLAGVETLLQRHMDYKQLLQQSLVDELTGLANRSSILKALKERLTLRLFRPLSVMMLDLDHFKAINDEYGHPAGDAVLSNVGKCLQELLRSYDKAGRYGGEEFLILLPETNIADALLAAEKIRRAVQSLSIRYEHHTLRITVSIGVASLTDNEADIARHLGLPGLREVFEVGDKKHASWDEIETQKSRILDCLILFSDRALYRAKATRCRKCGFLSGKAEDFRGDACPKCGGTEIRHGRNRIARYAEPSE